MGKVRKIERKMHKVWHKNFSFLEIRLFFVASQNDKMTLFFVDEWSSIYFVHHIYKFVLPLFRLNKGVSFIAPVLENTNNK